VKLVRILNLFLSLLVCSYFTIANAGTTCHGTLVNPIWARVFQNMGHIWAIMAKGECYRKPVPI